MSGYYNHDEEEKWNSYFYPETSVFKNKLDIHNNQELNVVEKKLVDQKILELKDNPIEGNFDIKHLCDIHKYLFDDLYDWAGKIRDVTMTKEGYSKITAVSDIEMFLEKDLILLKQGLKNVYNLDTFAELLADFYMGLATIHPFREGNGRAIREFLREFVISKSTLLGLEPAYTIDWSLVDRKIVNETMHQLSGYSTLIKLEIRRGLVPYNPEKKKQL